MSYENTSSAYATTSSLSEFVGPSAITTGHPVSQVRSPGGYAPSDTFEWTSREINILPLSHAAEYLPMGPASTAVRSVDPLRYLPSWIPFQQVMHYFLGFSYESIQVRVTLNNPKGIVGGLFAGWYPYVDYFDEDVATTTNLWIDGNSNNMSFINSTDCQFFSFGDAQDVVFTIPWTFKYPMFRTTWLKSLNTSNQHGRPPVGFPVIFVQNYESNYITSISMPAQMQIFIKFTGLQFYGPTVIPVALKDPKGKFKPQANFIDSIEDFEPQSGGEVLAAAAVGALMETAISKVADVITPFSDSSSLSVEFPTPEPGNFDNPSAVQMSYFGDITTRGKPQVRPVFMSGLPPSQSASKTDVKKYLSQPAFVGQGSSASPMTVRVCPTATYDYMCYFAMVNRFWRGIINYHVYVTGHPMVQTKVTVTVNYIGGTTATTANRFNVYDTLQETFYGSKAITVPAPFLTNSDYLPIADPMLAEHIKDRSVSCLITISLEVVSTMLDLSPTIPFFVFRTAGDDFGLYQPYPPGLYNTPDAGPFEEITDFEPQVGIPTYDHTVMNSRYSVTEDPKTLTPFTDFMDLMQTWSRAVPFDQYNAQEEPVPLIDAGFAGPCWFPPVDRARDYEAQNSWYFTVDYVHYFSILFLYYRGSIAGKITYNDIVRTDSNGQNAGVLYLSLGSDLTLRSPSHCPYSHDYKSLPPIANFGAGTFATSPLLQPVLECNVPMRATTTWSNCIPQMIPRGVARNEDEKPAGVFSNILLLYNGKLCDQFARKADSDFALAVESPLPPVQFWMHRGTTG